jgi:hypothetical protein
MKSNYVKSIYGFGAMLLIGTMLMSCKVTESSSDATYRNSVGTGTETDIVQQVESILARFYYPISRKEIANNIYYETDWVLRLPLEDEAEMAVQEVRTKIIIDTRPFMRGEPTPAPLFNITFVGQAEYRLVNDSEWYKMEITRERNAYFGAIAYEMRTQFSSRLRN